MMKTCRKFNVSIQTIRLDRMELKIPELRRIKDVAERSYAKVRSIDVKKSSANWLIWSSIRGQFQFWKPIQHDLWQIEVVRGDIILHKQIPGNNNNRRNGCPHRCCQRKINFLYTRGKAIAKAEVTRVRSNKKFVFVRIYVKQKFFVESLFWYL